MWVCKDTGEIESQHWPHLKTKVISPWFCHFSQSANLLLYFHCWFNGQNPPSLSHSSSFCLITSDVECKGTSRESEREGLIYQ